MQKEAKITSKGQITIPREVRDALGVSTGDKILFEQKGDEMCVRPVRKTSVFEKFRGIGNPGMNSGRNAVLRKTREVRGRKTEE